MSDRERSEALLRRLAVLSALSGALLVVCLGVVAFAARHMAVSPRPETGDWAYDQHWVLVALLASLVATAAVLFVVVRHTIRIATFALRKLPGVI